MNTKIKGFTLIELLIVITIIGILAVALLPRLLEGPQRARDTARVADLNNLASILQTYNIDYGQFPESGGDCTQKGPDLRNSSDPSDLYTALVADNAYLSDNNFPKDPQAKSNSALCGDNSGYWYKSLSDSGVDQAGYVLAADVENDRQANVKADTIEGATTIEEIADMYTKFDQTADKGAQSVYTVTSR